MDGAREVAWAVSRVGSTRDLDGEFDALVHELEQSWVSLFPKRLGYRTSTEQTREGSTHSVRWRVERGDFIGQVQLCREGEREGDEVGVIRAVASAESQQLQIVSRRGARVVACSRGCTTAIGVLLGIGFCWFAAGTTMVPVIGGLLLTVLTSTLVLVGSTLGARIGEGLAARRRNEVELALQADPGVQADLKRWSSLSRQLRWHRRALSRSLQGAPFRRAVVDPELGC